MRWLALLAGAVLLITTGCARTEWVHPTADAERAAADRAECDNTARIRALEQVQFEAMPRRSLGTVGFPQAGSTFHERNSEWYWTQHYRDRCMIEKGYRLTEVR